LTSDRNSAASPTLPTEDPRNFYKPTGPSSAINPRQDFIEDTDSTYSNDKNKEQRNQNVKYFILSSLPKLRIIMPPFESVAYANATGPQNMFSKITYFCRQHATAITAAITFVCILTIITSDVSLSGSDGSNYQGLRLNRHGSGEHWGGASHVGYFHVKDAVPEPNKFKFAAVTDMDELSIVQGSLEAGKPKFNSFLLPGTLTFDLQTNTYSPEFEQARTLVSGHNEAGRGMELSELVLFNDRLLAFDDRTGSIFEVLSEGNDKSIVVPRFVITEGEGDTDKGMKWEWSTVKDEKLYIGSMGKEFTRPDGSIVNTNNLWIATVDKNGQVVREDWKEQYNFVRNLLGCEWPGYVIHEAVLWSAKLKKWIFIPRRISQEQYDDVKDEYKGSNKIVLVDEKFTTGEVVNIKFIDSDMDPLHGFSTAAFVPNTNDQHIVAMRSVEENCVGGDETLCKQRSYMTVFDVLTGDVLMNEVEIEGGIKYEGVEFVDVSRTSPITA